MSTTYVRFQVFYQSKLPLAVRAVLVDEGSRFLLSWDVFRTLIMLLVDQSLQDIKIGSYNSFVDPRFASQHPGEFESYNYGTGPTTVLFELADKFYAFDIIVQLSLELSQRIIIQ